MPDTLAIASVRPAARPKGKGSRSIATHDQSSDEDLVAALADGQEWALESVYERYAERLWGFVFTRVRSAAASDDLIQDLFASLLVRRSALKVRCSLKAYLFKAAYYGAKRARRTMKATADTHDSLSEHDLPAKDASGPDALIDAERLQTAFVRAKAALPERCRVAYELVRDAGLTYAEAAAALSISEKAVELRMGRALRKLREALAPLL